MSSNPTAVIDAGGDRVVDATAAAAADLDTRFAYHRIRIGFAFAIREVVVDDRIRAHDQRIIVRNLLACLPEDRRQDVTWELVELGGRYARLTEFDGDDEQLGLELDRLITGVTTDMLPAIHAAVDNFRHLAGGAS